MKDAKGKRARPEGTKRAMVALLHEAIFNYVLTVEEYVFALSEGKTPERARKSARNYANDFFFHSWVLIIHFSFMPCRERKGVKEQKHFLKNAKLICQMCYSSYASAINSTNDIRVFLYSFGVLILGNLGGLSKINTTRERLRTF